MSHSIRLSIVIDKEITPRGDGNLPARTIGRSTHIDKEITPRGDGNGDTKLVDLGFNT